MSHRTIFKIITLVAAPLALLLMVEISLALFALKDTYHYEDPFLGFRGVSPLFEQSKPSSAAEAVYVTSKLKLTWFNEQSFPLRKPENGLRIFCFGGSTTFGRPYTHETAFPAWLGRITRELLPGAVVEAINVGGVSYASYRIVNLMQEMLNYEPDVFIIYTGHNEFLEERTYSRLLTESDARSTLRAQLNKLRSYAWLRRAWLGHQEQEQKAAQTKFQMTGEVSTILDQAAGLDLYKRDSAKRDAILDHFQRNLNAMIDMAESNNVRIIFAVPPSNIKDFSPFKSEIAADLSPNALMAWRAAYDNGLARLAEGEFEMGYASLNQAIEIAPMHADSHFRKGQSLFRLGQYDEAESEFTFALDLDVAPLRADSRIKAILRQVIEERSVPSVDLDRLLEHKSLGALGHSILGKEFFLDHAHPTIEVHQMLGEEFAKLLLVRGIIESQIAVSELNTSAIYRGVMDRLDPAYFAIRDLNLAKILNWAGKKVEAKPFVQRAAHALPDHAEAQFMLGLAYQEETEIERAETCFRKALALDSTFALAYDALGTVYDARDFLEEALRNFQRAIHHRPGYGQAYYNKGAVLYKMSRPSAAAEAFEEALRIVPRHFQALNNLGVIYMNAGRHAEARHAFEGVLKLAPRHLRAYNNLGVIFSKEGEWQKAQEMFANVLRIEPDNDFARKWMSLLADRN